MSWAKKLGRMRNGNNQKGGGKRKGRKRDLEPDHLYMENAAGVDSVAYQHEMMFCTFFK